MFFLATWRVLFSHRRPGGEMSGLARADWDWLGGSVHTFCSPFLFPQSACINNHPQKEGQLHSWPRCWKSRPLMRQATHHWQCKWDCFKFNLIKNGISDYYIVYCKQKVDGDKLNWLDVFFSLCNSSPFPYRDIDHISSQQTYVLVEPGKILSNAPNTIDGWAY